MRRLATTEDGPAVSLFPFLAVLLCTMGGLLVVLVALATQARTEAARQMSVPTEPTLKDVAGVSEEDEPDFSAQLQKLTAVREEAQSRLRDDRARLRHMEDHIRRLQKQLAVLKLQEQELHGLDEARTADLEVAKHQLALLEQQIAESKAELAEARRLAATQPKSYAIIPFEGRHGTRRRPLYIECRRDVVILQPERIQLTPDDFRGPLGPGNPLAAALRAAVEYHTSRVDNPLDDDVQPYPLLLVRPEGVAAYYQVRAALSSWGPHFGYELVDGDWDLEFPVPNAQLATLQQHAVMMARRRQAMLAAAAPTRFAGLRGGRSGGPAGGGGSFVTGEGGRRSFGTGHGGYGDDDDDWGQSGSSGLREAEIPGETSPGERFSSSMHAAQTDQAHGSPGRGGDAMSSSSPDGPGGTGVEHQPSGGPLGTSAPGRGGGGPPYPKTPYDSPSGQASQQHGTGGHGGEPFESVASNNAAGPAGVLSGTSTQSGGRTGGASPARGGGPAGGATNSATGGFGTSIQGSATSGEAGGNGWSPPRAVAGAVPIRRAIHVVVRPDRLAILPEPGAGGGRLILLDGPTGQNTQRFIAAFREHVDSWGMAGNRLYWAPFLVFKIGNGGHGVAARLAKVMRRSGIEVRMPRATTP